MSSTTNPTNKALIDKNKVDKTFLLVVLRIKYLKDYFFYAQSSVS